MKPKDMIGRVRITKAPDPMWIGVEGPLRPRLSSEPMIPAGHLVFGAVSRRELVSPPPPGSLDDGFFFGIDPDGDPRWDFEPVP